MNRLDNLFQTKKENILSVYFTAGFPAIDDTVKMAKELEKNGVGFIEIGMPFSDPIADGPVIQEASKQALENGMSIDILFSQLEKIREEVSMPIILMGYINPIFQYGIEAFCKKASEIGIDGLIVPDLPFDLYLRDYKELFAQYNLHNINLISPTTSAERIALIDKHSTSFIYVVSSTATTGTKGIDDNVLKTMFTKLDNLTSPTVIGFGISNKKTIENAFQYANGAIIGTAFIKALLANNEVKPSVRNFVEQLDYK